MVGLFGRRTLGESKGHQPTEMVVEYAAMEKSLRPYRSPTVWPLTVSSPIDARYPRFCPSLMTSSIRRPYRGPLENGDFVAR